MDVTSYGRNKDCDDEIKKNQETANSSPSYRCAAIKKTEKLKKKRDGKEREKNKKKRKKKEKEKKRNEREKQRKNESKIEQKQRNT